jgi:1-aminocyclopropane-1-carboxylate synthase
MHGLSKDFCSSGLWYVNPEPQHHNPAMDSYHGFDRLGVLITRNGQDLTHALAPLSLFTKISTPADCLFSALLTEPHADGKESFVSWFMRENSTRLGSVHEFAVDWFNSRGVDVTPSNAGHFIWVNIGKKMGWKTVEEEEAGFCRIFDAGLYIVSPLDLA